MRVRGSGRRATHPHTTPHTSPGPTPTSTQSPPTDPVTHRPRGSHAAATTAAPLRFPDSLSTHTRRLRHTPGFRASQIRQLRCARECGPRPHKLGYIEPVPPIVLRQTPLSWETEVYPPIASALRPTTTFPPANVQQGKNTSKSEQRVESPVAMQFAPTDKPSARLSFSQRCHRGQGLIAFARGCLTTQRSALARHRI